MAISNQHFNYDIKVPVYEQIPEMFEIGQKLGQIGNFKRLNEKVKEKQRLAQLAAQAEPEWVGDMPEAGEWDLPVEEYDFSQNGDPGTNTPLEEPPEYEPGPSPSLKALQESAQNPQPEQTPGYTEQTASITTALAQNYPGIPPEQLENIANQAYMLTELNKQYEDSKMRAETALEDGDFGFYDYFSNRNSNFINQIKATQAGLREAQKQLEDYTQSKEYFQHLGVRLGEWINITKDPNYGKMGEEYRDYVEGQIRSLDAALKKNRYGSEVYTSIFKEPTDKTQPPDAGDAKPPRAIRNEKQLEAILKKDGLAKALNALDKDYESKSRNSNEYLDKKAFLERRSAEIEKAKEKQKDDNEKYESYMKTVLALENRDENALMPAFNDYMHKLAGANVSNEEKIRHVSAVLKSKVRAEFQRSALNNIKLKGVPFVGKTLSELNSEGDLYKYMSNIDYDLLAAQIEKNVTSDYSKEYKKKHKKTRF